MKYRLLMVLLALGLCSEVLAEEKTGYSRVALVGPGASQNPIERDDFIIVVVEGPYLSYDKNVIPETGVIDYVNNLLKLKKVSYVGVHTREGVKYGDVIRAVDELRKTNAKNIGISMKEIPVGVNP